MEAFDILGDPVRRRILELLAAGERSAGDVVDVVRAEFGLTQPAVSRQLRVLRESGFAAVRAEGTRRLYALNGEALDGVESWLTELRRQWSQRLDALETELARGRRRDTDQRPRRDRRG
ncbi:MAG: hypothetical protein QOG59_1056 [Solirubrobacteraceae bacterium]|nr:hypothetical protein [Solirubrobacteraceae bacterium]